MHQNNHFIMMSSQMLLHVSAYQRYHQGAHVILTSYWWAPWLWHWYVETCRSVLLDITINCSFLCICWFSIRIYTKLLSPVTKIIIHLLKVCDIHAANGDWCFDPSIKILFGTFPLLSRKWDASTITKHVQFTYFMVLHSPFYFTPLTYSYLMEIFS
jgi:hypothetical protein